MIKFRRDEPPSKLSNKDLVFAHAIMHTWFREKKRGQPLQWGGRSVSLEDIVNYHALVVQEMKRRGMVHHDTPRDTLNQQSRRFERAEESLLLLKFVQRFIPPNKPALRIYETSDVDDLEFKGRALVDTKWDGARLQIHKKGDRIGFYTEDKGLEKTRRLPVQVSEMKDQPDGIFDAEAVAIRDGKHLHRTTAAGYLNATGDTEGAGIIHLMIFDVLHIYDKDCTKMSLHERIDFLTKFKATKHLHPSRYTEALSDRRAHGYICEGSDKAKRAIKIIRDRPGSEGVMLKDLAAPYRTDTNQNRGWAKMKNLLEVDVKVLEVRRV